MAGNNSLNNINETLTVEQKFAKIMLKLRILRPFYSAVYEVMEKHESSLIPTIGVDCNSLSYNREFIDTTPFEELVFINLHEVAHVALGHVSRMENRNQKLWNVACDLYVNQMLAEEFGLTPGGSVTVNDVTITMPTNGLFCSSIDLDVDYVENIYDELEKQALKNGFKLANKMISSLSPNMGGNSQGGEDGQSQDNKRGSQKGQGDGQCDGQQKQDQCQGQGQGKPGQQGQRGRGNLGSNNGQFGFKFHYKGSKKVDNSYRHDSRYDVFEGLVTISNDLDLIHTGEDQSIMSQKTDKVVSDALVRVEMSSTNCGGEAGVGLMSIIKEMRKSKVNWKKLLRKYLIAATSSDSSFSKPDKRMYYQKSIYPGQVQNEENSVKGVKVCIDTSGSISDEDIEYFCGQVYDLTKQFKIEAELIYWDTSIESTGEFTGYKEFERVKLYGRGGTDPSVIFKYFDSKKCKIKPIVTLVFTDAYFSTDGITQKQRKKYKDTIWIMTRNHDTSFKPPFGKKALARFE